MAPVPSSPSTRAAWADEWLAGLTVMAGAYRDALVGGNVQRPAAIAEAVRVLKAHIARAIVRRVRVCKYAMNQVLQEWAGEGSDKRRGKEAAGT